MYGHGYEFDAKWEFWREAAKIRDSLDGAMNDYEKGAIARERAAEHVAKRMDVLWVDRLCDPWFS